MDTAKTPNCPNKNLPRTRPATFAKTFTHTQWKGAGEDNGVAGARDEVTQNTLIFLDDESDATLAGCSSRCRHGMNHGVE